MAIAWRTCAYQLDAAHAAERDARERLAAAERDEAHVQAQHARRQTEEERAARADAQATLDVIVRSRSWRLTSVARRAVEELRRRRPKG